MIRVADREWEIPVVDGVGRPRVLRVRAGRSGVVMIPPPGEGYTVAPDQVEALRTALAEARRIALTEGGW